MDTPNRATQAVRDRSHRPHPPSRPRPRPALQPRSGGPQLSPLHHQQRPVAALVSQQRHLQEWHVLRTDRETSRTSVSGGRSAPSGCTRVGRRVKKERTGKASTLGDDQHAEGMSSCCCERLEHRPQPRIMSRASGRQRSLAAVFGIEPVRRARSWPPSALTGPLRTGQRWPSLGLSGAFEWGSAR